MTLPIHRVLLSLGAAALFAAPVLPSSVSPSALADDSAPKTAPNPPNAAPADGTDRGERGGRMRRRFAFRHARARHFLRALDLSDDQKKAFHDARESTATVRDDAQAKIREILTAARTGEKTPESRERVRAAVRGVFDSAKTAVEPTATRLVSLLTPEQKQKIADRAAKRGVTVDDAMLAARVERLLLLRGRAHGEHDAK